MELDWHTPQVNKHRVWQSYVDSYNNHAFGILQENCQNSFDAYVAGTQPKNMKVVVKYDADNRVLSHRDFGTTGMTHCNNCEWGIREKKIECTNSECAWGSFHNMGYSNKGAGELGSRGMGKALQLLAGSKTVVITTLQDGRYQASLWERTSGDWKWRLDPNSAKRLSSPGTEIITSGVIGTVHEQFLDRDSIISELQERWFRLLAQGATIEYLLIKGGIKIQTVVKKPTMPELDLSQGKEKSQRLDSNVVITYRGKKMGDIRNLHLYLSKRRFYEGDSRRGIAIVKNGKQTITRFTDFPEEIPEQIRSRLFGYCDAICTESEPFLKDAENAQHTGYQLSHPTWKAVRKELREIVKQFTQPFIRAGGEVITQAEQEEATEILAVLNEALSDIPDFNLFGKETVGKKRKVNTTPKNYIYLSRIEFEKKEYKRGDNVLIEAIVKNPTPKETMVWADFEHFDPTPMVVEYGKDATVISAGTPEEPGTASIQWTMTLDPSSAPGIHFIQASLKDRNSESLLDDENVPIKGRRNVYCEFVPKKITRSRSGAGEPKDGSGTAGGEGNFGFAGMQFFKKSDLRDEFEAYIDMSQAVAFVNIKGRRLEYAKLGAKTKKVYWPVVAEVVGEKLLELKATMDAEEKETWTAEELKNEITELQETKAKLVRRVIQLLGEM